MSQCWRKTQPDNDVITMPMQWWLTHDADGVQCFAQRIENKDLIMK